MIDDAHQGLLRLCGAIGLAAALVAPLQAVAEGPDFCARLAGNAGIAMAAPVGARSKWTANALSFGQRWLVGGTASTGVGVQPVEPATVEDFKRMRDLCQGDIKGAICKLEGPLDFQFVWRGKETHTIMAPGEAATVVVRGLKSSCETTAP